MRKAGTASKSTLSKLLKEKSARLFKETVRIHRLAPETRIASSVSCVEILVALFHGGLIRFNPKNPFDPRRDRFIVSKGHGSISFYPLLAELGYFNPKELKKVCAKGSFLGGIPDPCIPGYETINGSLGHGPGVACGVALALKRKKRKERVFVLLGDGELNEGSVWEALMFAGHHKLSNLVVILDNNRICMLDYCRNVIDLEPLDRKFAEFGFEVKRCNGHDVMATHRALKSLTNSTSDKPKFLIADTVKGHNLPTLENKQLCHIMALSQKDCDAILGDAT